MGSRAILNDHSTGIWITVLWSPSHWPNHYSQWFTQKKWSHSLEDNDRMDLRGTVHGFSWFSSVTSGGFMRSRLTILEIPYKWKFLSSWISTVQAYEGNICRFCYLAITWNSPIPKPRRWLRWLASLDCWENNSHSWLSMANARTVRILLIASSPTPVALAAYNRRETN